MLASVVWHQTTFAQEAEARIGTMLLGKWRIERLIGVGGMAVYEAHHRNESRWR